MTIMITVFNSKGVWLLKQTAWRETMPEARRFVMNEWHWYAKQGYRIEWSISQ